MTKSIREGIDVPTKYGTMFDGEGDDDEENQDDDDLADDDDTDDDSDDDDDTGVQEVSMFGNKYSLDEAGLKKLAEDGDKFQTSFHTNQRELLDMKRANESGTQDDDDDTNDNEFPFDTEGMEKEDRQAAEALQSYIENEIDRRVEKKLEPFADKELTRDIQAELKEVESTYGKVNQEELMAYAKKNGLVTNLVAAYRDMTYDQQIAKGRKLEAQDQIRKKRGILPSGKSKGGKKHKSVKFDPEKHRGMSYQEVLEMELQE